MVRADHSEIATLTAARLALEQLYRAVASVRACVTESRRLVHESRELLIAHPAKGPSPPASEDVKEQRAESPT